MISVVERSPKLGWRGKVREGWAAAGQVSSYNSPVSWAAQQTYRHSTNLLEAKFETMEGPWVLATFGSR